MSIDVISSHNGESYRTNIDSYSNLEEFRAWIFRRSGVQVSDQILLTDKGRPVKFKILHSDSTIYLYDRTILATSASASKLLNATEVAFTEYHAPGPPGGGSEGGSVTQIQALTFRRRDWAQEILAGATPLAEQIKKDAKKLDNVRRGTAIAVQNLRDHLANLEPKFEETKRWAEQVLTDQQSVLSQWKPSYERAARIPVAAKFAQCLKEGDIALQRIDRKARGRSVTLQDFVDGEDLEQIGAAATSHTQGFSSGLEEIKNSISVIRGDSEATLAEYQRQKDLSVSDHGEQADRLLEEIEVLSRKIRSDAQNMGEAKNDSKSRSQASKMAQMHGQDFMPSILQAVHEITDLGNQLAAQRKEIIQHSTHILQDVSIIESQISAAHGKLAKLDVDPQSEELFNLLDLVISLPAQYGQALIEYVRRAEWAQRKAPGSSALDREHAYNSAQESKRRAQWDKDMEALMTFNEQGNIGLATNASVNEPLATREDIDKYINTLSADDAFSENLKEVRKAARALEQNTKRLAPFENAFKNGSIHEASFGRDSVAAPPQIPSVQELSQQKLKADEKLRSAESRIRKLEDLLHRQTQIPRPPSANSISLTHAPSFERQVTSPVTNFTSALSKARDVGSRRSSTSSRRVSQNLDSEEKGLAQRIVSLEAELMSQRELTKELRKDVKARMNAEENLKSQAKEAIATKEDLLGNMESQQHEFENERRLLKDENTSLGIRLEELEDEFDRMLNNNEHDNKIQVLQEEVERLRGHNHELDAARQDDMHQHQRQIKEAHALNQDRQHRNQELEAVNNDLNFSIRDHEEQQTLRRQGLESMLGHLSHTENAPEDTGALIQRLNMLAQTSAAQHSQLSKMVDQLRADNQSLESRLRTQTSEVEYLRSELKTAEGKVQTLDEQILNKTTESSSIQTQLDTTLEEKEILQSMFKSSEGEVEALKNRLQDEEINHRDLQGRFTSLQGFHGDLDDQLRERNEELSALQQREHDAAIHSSAQADRAEHVSKQLLLQIEGSKKVLDMIGLMMTRQGDAMTVSKIPKAPSAVTTAPTDPASSMRRSVSGPLPTSSELEALLDAEALRWANAGSAEAASTRYSALLNAISDFDLQVYNEAIIKRIKEVEHIARKWQRDAKSYRERSRAAQNDAHERIALRAFKEGDLALFLPTRDQATKPWAAFNVGAPHYFLREQDSHRLAKRDWLIARISKVEERIVDLSKSMNGLKVPGSNSSTTDDNPYELSDGLRWFLVDAAEEKPGAPISIGTGKATVAVSTGAEPINISKPQPSERNEASKTLARSLDSRRSSTNSRKSWVVNQTSAPSGLDSMLKRTDSGASKHSGERASIEAREQERGEPSRMQEIQPTEIEIEGRKGSSPTKLPRQSSQSPSKASRARSPNKGRSPEKGRGKWDSIMSLDYSLEGGSGG